jgi:hypothetical protein
LNCFPISYIVISLEDFLGADLLDTTSMVLFGIKKKKKKMGFGLL